MMQMHERQKERLRSSRRRPLEGIYTHILAVQINGSTWGELPIGLRRCQWTWSRSRRAVIGKRLFHQNNIAPESTRWKLPKRTGGLQKKEKFSVVDAWKRAAAALKACFSLFHLHLYEFRDLNRRISLLKDEEYSVCKCLLGTFASVLEKIIIMRLLSAHKW